MSKFLKKRDWGQTQPDARATVAKVIEETQSAPRATPKEGQKVNVQFIGQNSGGVLEVRDISTSGVAVFVGMGFMYNNVQKEQQFVIGLPGIPSFLVTGFVKHYRTKTDGKEHLGIEFRKISDKYKMVIRDYVNTRIEEEQKNQQQSGSFVTVSRIRT